MNMLSGRCLEVGYGAAEGLAASMVRQWLSIFCGVAQVEHHQHFFIFGKFQFFCHFLWVEEVHPAAVCASVLCGEHHVRSHNGGVFDAGVARSARIGENVFLVEGYDKHCGGAVATRGKLIDKSKLLGRLHHVNMLLLQVFCGGCHAPCFQDSLQSLFGNGLAVELFARVTIFNYFFELHDGPFINGSEGMNIVVRCCDAPIHLPLYMKIIKNKGLSGVIVQIP